LTYSYEEMRERERERERGIHKKKIYILFNCLVNSKYDSNEKNCA